MALSWGFGERGMRFAYAPECQTLLVRGSGLLPATLVLAAGAAARLGFAYDWGEYQVAAACQACQDAMYLGMSDEEPLVRHPVRHGVIVRAVTADDCLYEVALLPFLFVVPSARIVWGPRYIVRAGSASHPIDPWVELRAMRDEWKDCNVRALCIPESTTPLVCERLVDRALVICLDAPAVRVASDLCPSAKPPALVNFAAELPWREAYGADLVPLAPFLRAHALDVDVDLAEAFRGSALRQCALIARLLALRATSGRDVGRTAFELLLLTHASRFAESFRESSDAVS